MENNEQQILSIAQEECAEVIQIISKIFRFGFTGRHPDMPDVTNKDRLEEEVGDLMCMIDLMIKHGIIDEVKLVQAKGRKLEKLKKWSSISYE